MTMFKKIGLALLSAAALVLLPLSAASAAETDPPPLHTGYFYYAANDYEHQTLAYENPDNTVTTPPVLTNLPCGTWSVQADAVPVTTPFPATLNPNATPLHPVASAHYFSQQGTKDCTPPPPPADTHSKHSTETKHSVVVCEQRQVDTTHVVTTVYKTNGKVTKTTHRTFHTYHNLSAAEQAKCNPVTTTGKTPSSLAYTGAGDDWPIVSSIAAGLLALGGLFKFIQYRRRSA